MIRFNCKQATMLESTLDIKNKAIALNNQGVELHNDGKYIDAIEKYDEAITYDNNAIYHSNKASAYIELKQYEKAIEACNIALKLNPELLSAKQIKTVAKNKKNDLVNSKNKLFLLSKKIRNKLMSWKQEIKTFNLLRKSTGRLKRSIEILRKEGVPYADWLPEYTSNGLRSKEEICNRVICLMILSIRAKGCPLQTALEIAQKYNVIDCFSLEEKQFLQTEEPTEKDRSNFSWRCEAYLVLMWVLGYIKELSRPEAIADFEVVDQIIYDRDNKQFIQDAKLRSLEEVLDLADLTLRYHWAARNEMLNGNSPPTNLDENVLYERHYAFNWVLNKEADWDKVDTST